MVFDPTAFTLDIYMVPVGSGSALAEICGYADMPDRQNICSRRCWGHFLFGDKNFSRPWTYSKHPKAGEENHPKYSVTDSLFKGIHSKFGRGQEKRYSSVSSISDAGIVLLLPSSKKN